MGEALSLVIGGLTHEHALIFAAGSVLLQVFVPYRRYAPVLKFLTLTLFVYVATAFTVKIPWIGRPSLCPRPRVIFFLIFSFPFFDPPFFYFFFFFFFLCFPHPFKKKKPL